MYVFKYLSGFFFDDKWFLEFCLYCICNDGYLVKKKGGGGNIEIVIIFVKRYVFCKWEKNLFFKLFYDIEILLLMVWMCINK